MALFSSPGKTWAEISERGAGREIMPDFVYPLIGLCGLSEFISTFIGKDVSSELFQLALTRCCALAVALFGAFSFRYICSTNAAGYLQEPGSLTTDCWYWWDIRCR